jgi:hypothetical protein
MTIKGFRPSIHQIAQVTHSKILPTELRITIYPCHLLISSVQRKNIPIEAATIFTIALYIVFSYSKTNEIVKKN